MRRVCNLTLPLIVAIVGTLALAAPAHAAAYGVQDNGNLFSTDAVAKADDVIRQIRSSDDRDVLVVTYDAIPADRQDDLQSKGKERFYADWAEDIGKQNAVSGIVILLTKDPGHLQVAVGNKTRQQSFSLDDRDRLTARMLPLLKENQYDNALLQGLDFIKATMQHSQSNAGVSTSPNSPGATNFPGQGITPPHGFSVTGLFCVGIVILGVVFFIMRMVNRNRGYGGGYGAPPPGGYPQGGGYFGGGGGGFGSGLLGGLLGGALGSWGYDRFNQGSSNPNYIPPATGAGGDFGNSSSQADTSFSSTGGDFGSSPDSGSSGGGADFGSSADSGGGGDFGGGGDSGGGSSGGDF